MSKKALIIGNSRYEQALGIKDPSLSNPVNDAKNMAEILEYKEFEVTLLKNMNEYGLKNGLTNFISTVNEGDDVLFFFAGHGTEHRDTNYLMPIDCFSSGKMIDNSSISIDEVQMRLNKVNSTGTKIIIADACRNNQGLEVKGFTKAKSINNTIIAFSTSPGNVAYDGKESNGRYTKALIASMSKYGLGIQEVFRQTREILIKETGFRQIPWEHSSLTNNFTLDSFFIPKLNSMMAISDSPVYSILAFKSSYFIAKNSAFISHYSQNIEYTKDSIQTSLEDVAEITSNGSVIAFVGGRSYAAYDITGDKTLIEAKVDHTLHTISINNNNVVAIGGESRDITIHDLKSGTCESIDIGKTCAEALYKNEDQIKHFSNEMSIYASEFHAQDENILAVGGAGHSLVLCDIETKEILFINDDRDLFNCTYSIAFSQDGSVFATSHDKGKSILWNTNTFEKIHMFQINEYNTKSAFQENKSEKMANNVFNVEFSPCGKGLAMSTSESKILFYDLKYKTLIGEIDLTVEAAPIFDFTYSEDGKNLIVSVRDRVYSFLV